MDNPILIVLICIGNSIRIQRAKEFFVYFSYTRKLDGWAMVIVTFQPCSGQLAIEQHSYKYLVKCVITLGVKILVRHGLSHQYADQDLLTVST